MQFHSNKQQDYGEDDDPFFTQGSQGGMGQTGELQKRLYDIGFNQKTMPSVIRKKGPSEQDPLLNAKIAPYKARINRLQPIVTKPQSVSIHDAGKKKLKSPMKGQNGDMDAIKQQFEGAYGEMGKTKYRMGADSISSQFRPGATSSGGDFFSRGMGSGNNDHLFGSPGAQSNQPGTRNVSMPGTANMNSNRNMSGGDNMSDAGNFMYQTSSLFPFPLPPPPMTGGSVQSKSQKYLAPVSSQQGSIKSMGFSQKFEPIDEQGADIPGEVPFYDRALLRTQGFNQTQAKRTKHLVDKISGQFNIHQRYLNNPQLGLNPGAGIGLNKTSASFFQTKSQQLASIEKHAALSGPAEPVAIEVAQNNQMLTDYKRPATQLDQYIDLILKNVTNIDEFIYLKSNNEDDPYDLTVVEYKVIKEQNDSKKYYTISRKGLCHYVNGKPTQFIQLAHWLKQRQTYDQIKSLKFFTKFRKWKTLKMWKKNVVKHKTKTCAKALQEKLFHLNPILCQTLLELRKRTVNMMDTFRFIAFENQQYSSSESTFDLQSFKNFQKKIQDQLQANIEKESKQCRVQVQKGFDECLKVLRTNQYMANTDEDTGVAGGGGGAKQGNQNFFRLKQSAYENLGFSENLDYQKRSELRKQCSQFIRFSYLVDFLALEALTNIYVFSVKELENKLLSLIDEEEYVCMDPSGKNMVTNANQPLFKLTVVPAIQDIEERYITVEPIKIFLAPPLGNSKDEDFNIIYHVRLKEKKVKTEDPKNAKNKKKKKEGEEQIEEEQEEQKIQVHEQGDEQKTIDRKVVLNICKLWLKMNPSCNSLESELIKTINDGSMSINVFERWSRHDDMTKYVSVLEEWDDMVGDDWEHPEQNTLKADSWLQGSSNDIFKELLVRAYDKAEGYIQKTFHKYLIEYWENSRLDVQLFKDENLYNPGESFHYTLQFLYDQKERFEQTIPYWADIGFLKIDTNQLRNKLIPSPNDLIKKFQSFLPGMLKDRNEEIRQLMKQNYDLLKGKARDIDEFVKRQNALRQIIRRLPRIKDRFAEINHIFNIADVQFQFKKEDRTSINDTASAIKNLDTAIAQAQDNAEKEIEKYKRQLINEFIPPLNIEIGVLNERVQDRQYLTDDISMDQAIKQLTDLVNQCQQLEDQKNKCNSYEKTLNMKMTDFEQFQTMKTDLDLRYTMWTSLKTWGQLTQSWIDGKFKEIDTDAINQYSEQYTKQVNKCVKNMPPNSVLTRLKDKVDSFKDTMPIVNALRNKNLQENHKQEIRAKIGKPNFDYQHEEFRLQDLIEMGINVYLEEIKEISTQATQQANLKSQFNELVGKWKEIQLVCKAYKADVPRLKDYYVLDQVEDLNTAVEELIANLTTISSSRYLKRLRDQVENLLREVWMAQETINIWLNVQKNWIYLENIFASNEIQVKLREESNIFEIVDKAFKQSMGAANKNNKLFKNVSKAIQKEWKKSEDSLNQIQKALDKLLEDKRKSFARFYFLSNDELLEILAKASEMEAIQRNLKKCFDGIDRLMQPPEQNSRSVIGMISPEGEQVKFGKQFIAQGEVDGWLNIVQDNMRDELRKLCKKGQLDFDQLQGGKTRKDWVMGDHIAQVVATVSQIVWTDTTEGFINAMTNDQEGENNVNVDNNGSSLQIWLEAYISQLDDLTDLINNGLQGIQHRSIVALITQDVHARDIIEELYLKEVSSVSDFLWQKQLRYYMEGESSDQIVVRQVNATIRYGYEYLGATTRLVITNLTDRCWITITGALNIKLGAAPAGPAGTGKTESTKDLAKGLGQFCVVFNCSDQVEFKLMERLFCGLAQQGAWACLDEFNRIDIQVLSVVAQQLLTIKRAWVEKKQKFMFFQNEITLKGQGYGVFITMNPGYAGRTELPDNLQVLFRPVSMMIPDYGLIAEIMLFAEGFKNAKSLSKKMVQLYKLSSEQLSQQDHYDFGMRAVKSVLVMAGDLKRKQKKQKDEFDKNYQELMKKKQLQQQQQLDNEEEQGGDLEANGLPSKRQDEMIFNQLSQDVLLIRAMRDSNVPKFLQDDLPLFSALIRDLFPDVVIPQTDYGELQVQIEKSMLDLGFQINAGLVMKVIQLFETFNVRFGVMLVGMTTSGKTTCYRVLQHAMTELRKIGHQDMRFQQVQTHVINPKSIKMGELYGQVNVFTQEWQDGLASKIMREAAADVTEQKQWVVFDGPVDAVWIENMNTVLDDNMMLCLANGQRIKLRIPMRMLFEVQDLRVASPATVSRCGMVYMTYEELGWRPYMESWINKQFGGFIPKKEDRPLSFGGPHNPLLMLSTHQSDQIAKPQILNAELRSTLRELFQKTVTPFLTLLRHSMVETIPTVDLQLVISLCNLLECFLTEEFGTQSEGERIENKKKYIEYVFAYAFAWSLGASVREQHFDRVSDFVRDNFPQVFIPAGETVYSYFLDTSSFSDVSFRHWNEKSINFQYDASEPYFNLLVPTIDTTRYSFIVQSLLLKKKHVYLTGSSGTGKSVLLAKLLVEANDDPQCIDHFPLIFSAQTSSLVTQLAIEGKLDKKKSSLYGAKANRKCVIFIDDVNMPSLEEYGAQPPIELLRLFVDRLGFWDRQQRYWRDIIDTCLLCSSAEPGGGRNALTMRFTRHFNMISLPQPSEKILERIFKSLLQGFLNTGFQDVIKRNADSIVQGTIDVYNRIKAQKLPIPAQFHYTFNLRDVSQVFQGMMMVSPQFIREESQIVQLWIHQVSRVFHDRLINDEDRDWFQELIVELLGRHFQSKWQQQDVFGEKRILFSDILRLELGKEYEEIKYPEKLENVLENQLEEYNFSSTNQMNLVFFPQCIEHILRIARVMRQPRGNALLIGVGGSGKQSLSKLSSFMLGNQVSSIEITKGYGTEQFREYMKELFRKTGIQGKGYSFLFTDTQILNEGFLEDVNNTLNSGEIPNLWQQDEKEVIMNEMRPINDQLQRPSDPDTIYKTFVERVRNNLHIVLCMSPIGDALRVRCRKFPSLVDCCAIDWFASWPEEALFKVAKRLFQQEDNFPVPTTLPLEELQENLAHMCQYVHISATKQSNFFETALKRKVYTTPKSYLDLIKLYNLCLKSKRGELLEGQNRLSSGLTKLEQAGKQIAQLQIMLTQLQPELEEKSKSVEIALKQVKIDSEKVGEIKQVVSLQVEKVKKQADKIQLIVDDAQRELDQVMPELNKAKEALNNIDRAGLQSLKGMPAPPQVVDMVFQGVMTILGYTKYDWGQAKIEMKDVNQFVEKLKTFDKQSIRPETMKRLNKILANPEFNIDEIKGKVSYAGDIAMFCKSTKIFVDVNEKVKPQKQTAAKLNAELGVKQASVDQKVSELNAIEDQLKKLLDDTRKMVEQQEHLEQTKKQTEDKLVRAQKLIELTKDEAIRWKETVGILNVEIQNLFGDVFLAASQISYNGPFTGIYRTELVNQWSENVRDSRIPLSENYTILKTLGDPLLLRDWMRCGLPSDAVSQENSIYVTQGYRWPLLIDPQLQANSWIRTMEKENMLRITKFTNSDFIRVMLTCMPNGYPVIVEDVDESLDPSIDTVLARAYYDSDGRTLIRFADQQVDYHKDFRIYMTTKKPNPNYLPEVFIKVTVVNFTATMEGLEDQLLGQVVNIEKPAIQQQRDENISNLAAFNKKIKESQKNILRLLAEAQAQTILDKDDLINTLQDSKETAIEIAGKIKESTILEEEIEKTRSLYKVVSIRGSILYFVIKDLALIDPMYQYSLQYITQVFKKSIISSEESSILQERLNILINNITKNIYTDVCRGLFQAHKRIFSFMVAISINKNLGLISQDIWSMFLRGSGIIDKGKMPQNPDKLLISNVGWDLAYALETKNEQFQGLIKHIQTKLALWKEYGLSNDPVEKPLPEEWNNLGLLEKMVVLKIFRPEKIMFAISQYILHYMGQFFLESPPVSMQSLYKDSSFKVPIIFVLSQGADPTSQIMNFAQEKNMQDALQIISLGQGQGQIASARIEAGKRSGSWVCLQNCHLAKSWMPTLEVIVEGFKQPVEDQNDDFRLFLTSMPANYFPVSILQNGIKITTEPPRGIRANMKRSWSSVTDEFLDSCTKKEAFHQLVWGLTYFHAIIQERRQFGPLGWNIRYEFNDSDLETSRTVVQMLLDEQSGIPWDSMTYVSGHINYGGRVTDDWDRRCLMTILEKFYTQQIISEKVYRFSQSAIYFVPEVSNVQTYLQYIETQLPIDKDDPDVFGMHENANITFQSQESDKIISTILSIQPRTTAAATGGGGGQAAPKTSDEIIVEIVDGIYNDLPPNLKQEDGEKQLFQENSEGLIPSLSTVLLQEMDRFNRLLNTMRKTLQNLQLAVQGIMVMSQELDATYFSLMNNQVPKLWEQVAYPSLQPLGSWIVDLKERVQFMFEWLQTGNPISYWMSGFFFPQGFLTGVLQTHARQDNIAIDQLQFSFQILDFDQENCPARPLEGVYINGLFLQGAAWDRQKQSIIDSSPGVTYYPMPIIYFCPNQNYDDKPEFYKCPVYKTSVRAGVLSTTGQSTNFVLTVDIPSTEQQPDFWILRGSALLCQLNE